MAAGEIVAQVIVQPLLFRRGRFTEDKKKVRSVESAGKIWIRSESNGCTDGEREFGGERMDLYVDRMVGEGESAMDQGI